MQSEEKIVRLVEPAGLFHLFDFKSQKLFALRDFLEKGDTLIPLDEFELTNDAIYQAYQFELTEILDHIIHPAFLAPYTVLLCFILIPLKLFLNFPISLLGSVALLVGIFISYILGKLTLVEICRQNLNDPLKRRIYPYPSLNLFDLIEFREKQNPTLRGRIYLNLEQNKFYWISDNGYATLSKSNNTYVNT